MSFKKLYRKESHLTTDAGCSVQGPARLSTVQRREVCVWRRSIKAPRNLKPLETQVQLGQWFQQKPSAWLCIKPKQRGST